MIASLSDVKSKLSEYIRISKSKGEPIVITVDSVPTAELRAINNAERQLTDAEVVMVKAFVDGVRSKMSKQGAFSAVELVKDDRR
jgi:antitoxin (DNA-binding transcriptional repressor) of toxin-antitoxin stability system